MSQTHLWTADCQQCSAVFLSDGSSELCLECRDEAMSRIEADILAAGGIPHPVFAAVPPGVVVKRICAECHRAFDPHTYPSATCYPCDEKLANRGQAAKAAARKHQPPGRAGGSPKKEGKMLANPYAAQWGHSSPEMDALHAMDRRMDTLQEGLTKTIQELKTDKLALTARAEQAEQHPEIVAANTYAEAQAELNARADAERLGMRRAMEEVVFLGVVLVAVLLTSIAGVAAMGLPGLAIPAIVLAFGFVRWRDERKRADAVALQQRQECQVR